MVALHGTGHQQLMVLVLIRCTYMANNCGSNRYYSMDLYAISFKRSQSNPPNMITNII